MVSVGASRFRGLGQSDEDCCGLKMLKDMGSESKSVPQMLHGLSAEIVLCKKYQQNENREMRIVKTPKNKQNLFSRSPLITSPVLHRQLTNLLINSILFFPVSRYLVLHQSNGEWSISIYAVFGLVFGWPVTCSWACI